MTSVTISIETPPTLTQRILAVAMAPAMVTIMGIDLRIRDQQRLLIHGIADEIAHVLTAVVVLAAIHALGFRISWIAGGIGGMLPDIDHILLWTGLADPVTDIDRGFMHTLGPTLAVLLLGVAVPPLRLFLVSLGLGMLTHVIRDSATSELPLFWPVSDEIVHLRYSLYLTFMVLCTIVAAGIVALGMPRRPFRSSDEES